MNVLAARTIRYDEITVGMKEVHDYVITPEVYQGFLAAFQDHSPVHVDKSFAKAQGFEGRVMHGSILNGFISHFVGMHFPGRFSLLLSVDLRFSNPSYLGDSIHMETVVSQKTGCAQDYRAGCDAFQHHPQLACRPRAHPGHDQGTGMKRTVVITGGTKGLGRTIALAFGRADYTVLALYSL